MAVSLHCDSISAGYGGELIVKDVTLEIPQGKITALIRPNGSLQIHVVEGLGQAVARSLGSGVGGAASAVEFRRREFARVLSFLPQQPVVPEGISVGELIAFGRYPYAGAFASLKEFDHLCDCAGSRGDRGIAVDGFLGHRALWWAKAAHVDCYDLGAANRDFASRRAHDLSRPSSPVGGVGFGAGAQSQGRTIVMVVHDMAHAAKYSDHIVVLKDGEIVAQGRTPQTLDADLIQRAFGISTLMVTDPESGRELPIAYGIHR